MSQNPALLFGRPVRKPLLLLLNQVFEVVRAPLVQDLSYLEPVMICTSSVCVVGAKGKAIAHALLTVLLTWLWIP